MATIGLYDIDLWHRGRAVPNLELMQYYNYYYKKGERILMLSPKDDEGRCNQIIYFKDNPDVLLPRTLNIYDENKSFTGYGFYKFNEKLPAEMQNLPPSYAPYDIYTRKLNMPISEYERMKRNSFVRIETENFADYKPDSKAFYIADRDPLNQPNIIDFINENKNKQFCFIHTPKLNDEATALKFMRYRSLFNKNCVINFHCSEDFFYDYFSDVIFKLDKFENETELNYQKRIIKIALWYKKNGTAFRFPYHVNYSDFTNKIISWAKDNSIRISYSDYYKNSKKEQNEIAVAPTELRLLLKQNPLTVTRQNLDLKTSL